LGEVVSAKRRERLPVVLTAREVRELLHNTEGTMWLISSLLYGTGMRLLEALRLPVKEVEFERRKLIVREGQGNMDRVTVLPENLIHSTVAGPIRPRQGLASARPCGWIW
jgi:site-specific recombinase XerD